MSTNKVYGDARTRIPLVELETRWDYDDPAYEHGIAETFSIDQSKHSLFGASKVAADVMVQEYGRYFGMPTCCLRGGCLTGPNHTGVELHGFLSYLVKCNLEGREYTVFGYKGKQVRDNIHSEDVARFIDEFCLKAPLRRGLQPRRRQGQLLLDPRGVRTGRGAQRQEAGLHLRGPEPHRRPHLLLQRPAQDEGPLPGWDITKSAAADHLRRSSTPGSNARCEIAADENSDHRHLRLRRQHAGQRSWSGSSRGWTSSASTTSAGPAASRTAALQKLGIQFLHGDIRIPSDFEACRRWTG